MPKKKHSRAQRFFVAGHIVEDLIETIGGEIEPTETDIVKHERGGSIWIRVVVKVPDLAIEERLAKDYE